MSNHESPVNEYDRPTKRRIQRRHGACEPCRSSKTKCDGRMPCGACRSERRRQCPCVYSEKAMKLQQVTAEIRRRAESEKRSFDEAHVPLSDDEARRLGPKDCTESTAHIMPREETTDIFTTHQSREKAASEFDADSASMAHPLSVCATVEEFKGLKPARGYSAQVVSRCNGFETSKNSATSHLFRDNAHSDLLAASPRPRLCSSDLSRAPIEVQVVGTRLDAVDNLVREGQLDRAWASLASIVREAQLIQDSTSGDRTASMSISWRRLWNNILDLEAQLGLTIGRPTCLVRARRSRPKLKNDAVSLEDSLEETRTDLYQHVQGILGLNLLNGTAIRDFLERARDILQHEPFTQIGLCTTEGHSAAVRDLHLNTHLLFMVVFCRMASLCDIFSRDLTNRSWSETPAADIIKSLNLQQPRQKLAYCRKMFRSANFILESFMTLHQSDMEQTGRNWIRCHSAYVAAVVLGIAKLRHEVEWHATTERLRRLEQIFVKLSRAHRHCHLFAVAVERLRDLNSVKEPASEITRNKHNRIKNRKRSAPNSLHASPGDTDDQALRAASTTSSASASPTIIVRRMTDMVEEPTNGHHLVHDRLMHDHQQEHEEYRQQRVATLPFEDPPFDHLDMFQDNSATYSQSNTSFSNTTCGSSSATSFSEPDVPLQAIADVALNHPGPPFAYPFPYHAFHPPMAWNNAPYVVPDQAPRPLGLEIPVMPQYGPEGSSMILDIGSSFGLQNTRNAKTSNGSAHVPSPLQAPSDDNVVSTRPSPSLQAASRLKNPAAALVGLAGHNNGNQPFSQSAKAPSSGGSLSRNSRRPSLDRRNSQEITHQGPSSAQDNRQLSSINWNPTCAVTTAHDTRPQLAHENLTLPNLGRRASADNIQHSHMDDHRPSHGQGFPRPIQQPPLQMMGQPMFTHGQIGYLNSATGMFEPHHLQGHYPPGHLQSFPKYFITDSGQIQEQCCRMSLDAGNAAPPPY